MAKRRKAWRQPGRAAERTAQRRRWVLIFGAIAAAALVLLVLLQPLPFGDHGHAAGTHGGTLHTLDGGSLHLHAEVVVGPTGALQIYPLGETPADAMAFGGKTVLAEFRADDDPEPSAVVLHPDSDAIGVPAPRLVGKLPGERLGRQMRLDVAGLVIQGESYALHFGWKGELPAAEVSRLVAEEQRDIYLRPAGRYTDDDIAANGRATASEKFRGLKASHGRHDAKGDMLCPTARLPADRRFEWVVDGRRLHFCCPQCIDEFVAAAKADVRPAPAAGHNGKDP
ncbi:MAG: hypothetical protein U0746_10385 [Gemmataceae bacterium]